MKALRKKLSINNDNQKKKRYRLKQIPMEGRLTFFEPEMLHTFPCRRETKNYLTVELDAEEE